MERGPRHSERVFRAAVSAFSSLSHPARQEASQLDDLALGLFDTVPTEARRFAAAALCDCDPAPRLLVRRLAEEPVEISAPLLVRSPALNDIDLIGLIARRGIAHARTIARRDNLHPVVASLIRALLARAEPEPVSPPAPPEPAEEEAGALQAVRDQLRSLMTEGNADHEERPALPLTSTPVNSYSALRDAALSGEVHGFAEALGRALDLRTARTLSLGGGATYSELLFALKALELSPEQALLLTLAAYPAQLSSPAAIRLFCVRYGALTLDAAREKVQGWQRQDQNGKASRSTAARDRS